jgi:hypothetical protein
LKGPLLQKPPEVAFIYTDTLKGGKIFTDMRVKMRVKIFKNLLKPILY